MSAEIINILAFRYEEWLENLKHLFPEEADDFWDEIAECFVCGGTGEVEFDDDAGNLYTNECKNCEGTGESNGINSSPFSNDDLSISAYNKKLKCEVEKIEAMTGKKVELEYKKR